MTDNFLLDDSIQAMSLPRLDELPEFLCKGVACTDFGALPDDGPLSITDFFNIIWQWAKLCEYGPEVPSGDPAAGLGAGVCTQSDGDESEEAIEITEVGLSSPVASPCKGADLEDSGSGELALSPQPSPKKRYRCKDPELEVPHSPRLNGKQTTEVRVTMKRHPRLCQRESCVFNSRQPGQPAVARDTTNCVWCDPLIMETSLQTEGGAKFIAKALTLFRKRPSVFEAALNALPADYEETRRYYCIGENCVFNSLRPGNPARRPSDGGSLCMWCEPERVRKLCESSSGCEYIHKAS